MKHVTDIGALGDEAIASILEGALAYERALGERRDPGQPLARRLQLNVFFENSTRTNLSFAIAGRKLGAEVLNLPIDRSSVQKGESLRDTIQTLSAMGADFLVLRATDAGTIDAAKSAIRSLPYDAAILNAGEGAFGHPTQALLDAATLLKALHRDVDTGLHGQAIAIVGDLLHSRVAASCAPLFARLGAEVRLCAPSDLMPAHVPHGVSVVTSNRDEALADADVVMALRIQTERFEHEMPLDPVAYRSDYGLSMEALSFAKPTAFVMHPGPMNRGIEIDHDVAEDLSRSLILEQVAMGVPTRMACLAYAAEV